MVGRYYESSDGAFNRFREQFKNSPILETSPWQPCRNRSGEVTDPQEYAQIASAVAEQPGVEQVRPEEVAGFVLHPARWFRALVLGIAPLIVTVLFGGEHDETLDLQQTPGNRDHACSRRQQRDPTARSCWRPPGGRPG